MLHKVWAKHPYHRDYLGFYTLDSHLLSPSVHGLLGNTPPTAGSGLVDMGSAFATALYLESIKGKKKITTGQRKWKTASILVHVHRDIWNKQICDAHNDVGSSGQFYHGIEYEVGDLRPGEVPEKPDATMYVKGRELTVTR